MTGEQDLEEERYVEVGYCCSFNTKLISDCPGPYGKTTLWRERGGHTWGDGFYGFPFDREVAQEVAYPMCVSLLSQRNLVELIRMEFTQDYAKTIPY